MQLLEGLILAAVVAAAAFRARALDKSGGTAAFVVGAIVFGFGGWAFAAPLLTFFITSTVLSRWRRQSKETLGYEKPVRRDSGQVLANGGVASLCVLIHAFMPGLGRQHAYAAYLAALAAANADTWATEVGSALGDNTVSIATFRRVRPGESGGVTLAGTIALALGALAVAVFADIFHPAHSHATIAAPLAGGICGAIVDSVIGATLQAQWRAPGDPSRYIETPTVNADSDCRNSGTTPQTVREIPDRGLAMVGNDSVNLICTISAAAIAWFLP